MTNLLSVSKREIIDNIKEDNFFRLFGNPVQIENDGVGLMSFELYERLFGTVDLSKEKTIEVDDFVQMLKEEEEKNEL